MSRPTKIIKAYTGAQQIYIATDWPSGKYNTTRRESLLLEQEIIYSKNRLEKHKSPSQESKTWFVTNNRAQNY